MKLLTETSQFSLWLPENKDKDPEELHVRITAKNKYKEHKSAILYLTEDKKRYLCVPEKGFSLPDRVVNEAKLVLCDLYQEVIAFWAAFYTTKVFK